MTLALQVTLPALTFVLLVSGWGLPIARRLPLPATDAVRPLSGAGQPAAG